MKTVKKETKGVKERMKEPTLNNRKNLKRRKKKQTNNRGIIRKTVKKTKRVKGRMKEPS